MRNIKFISFLFLSVSLIFTTSCSDDDDVNPDENNTGNSVDIIISNDTTTLQELAVGEIIKLEVSAEGSDNDFIFTSSDSDIVSVDADGNITGISEGVAQITVSVGDSYSVVQVKVLTTYELDQDNKDLQGIEYTLNSETQSAYIASGTYETAGNNQVIDFSSSNSSFVIPVFVTKDGVKYSVTKIEEYAFAYNYSIEQFYFAEGSKLEEIEYRAFGLCTNLGSTADASTLFSNAKNLKVIGNEAFVGSGLTVLDLSPCENLQHIQRYAFSESKVSEVNIQECINLLSIGAKAFFTTPIINDDAGKITLPNSTWYRYSYDDEFSIYKLEEQYPLAYIDLNYVDSAFNKSDSADGSLNSSNWGY